MTYLTLFFSCFPSKKTLTWLGIPLNSWTGELTRPRWHCRVRRCVEGACGLGCGVGWRGGAGGSVGGISILDLVPGLWLLWSLRPLFIWRWEWNKLTRVCESSEFLFVHISDVVMYALWVGSPESLSRTEPLQVTTVANFKLRCLLPFSWSVSPRFLYYILTDLYTIPVHQPFLSLSPDISDAESIHSRSSLIRSDQYKLANDECQSRRRRKEATHS